jgi:hypothetical protein
MGGLVEYPGGGEAVDEYRHGAFDNDVGRAYAEGLVRHAGSGQTADQDIQRTGRKDGTADMGDGWTPGFTIGQTCMSVNRAAGNPMSTEYSMFGAGRQARLVIRCGGDPASGSCAASCVRRSV